jgi:hypothetical protein
MYVYTVLFGTADIMTSQSIDLPSWDTLYRKEKEVYAKNFFPYRGRTVVFLNLPSMQCYLARLAL